MSFGKNVKHARLEKRMTLQALSERSSVSRSMISKIEREEKNPTIQIACQIAEGLDMSVSQLLGEQEKRQVVVVRRDQRLLFRDEQSGFERHLLSPAFPNRGVELIMNIIPPGGDSGAFPAHKTGVKENIVVEQGRLRAILGGQTFELESGDSIFFEADLEHRFVNDGEEDCRYYLVIDSSQVKG